MTGLPFAPGVIAVIRTATKEEARTAVAALIETRVSAIEITLTVPEAIDVVYEFAPRDQRIGVGTVRTNADAKRAYDAGAAFAISPHLDLALVETCTELGLPQIPGVATASELQHAISHGVIATKLFPISTLGGTRFVKAMSEPFPDATFIVSSGIKVEDVEKYRSAGCVGVCLGRALLDADALLRGDVGAAVEYAQRALAVAFADQADSGGNRAANT
jgi:2-dehydro-3-deoxyphosphogluconate aldolase/(4S)-4-hydroxy-2-oxoglutarate aldolase